MYRSTNPLVEAVVSGTFQTRCDLASMNNASIDNIVDGHGNTLLHLAVSHGQTVVCRALIENGASRLKRNYANNTAIMTAVSSGWFSVMVLLDNPPVGFIAGQNHASFASINHPTHISLDGITPLMMAAQHRRMMIPTIITILIRSGFDRAVADKINGETALMKAVCTGNRENVSALLETMKAVCTGNRENVSALLKTRDETDPMDASKVQRNATPEDHVFVQDNQGNTALHHVMTHVHVTHDDRINITFHLLQSGVTNLVNMINNEFNTALHIAVNRRLGSGVLTLLIQGGADPMIDSGDHICPLFNAIHIRSINNIPIQVLMGRDTHHFGDWFRMNSRDRWNRTPLLAAIEYENFHILKFMMEHGADLQAFCSISGNTALHWAAGKGRISLCKMIINLGGFNGHKNQKDRTPLEHVGLEPNDTDSDSDDEREMKEIDATACWALLHETAEIVAERNLALFQALHNRLGVACRIRRLGEELLRDILELAHGFDA